MGRLIDFLSEKEVKGYRNISVIHNYTHQELEDHHDYIQWIFPNDTSSKYNSDAPLLTKEDVEIIKKDVKNNGIIWNNIVKSLILMLDFWGYKITPFENKIKAKNSLLYHLTPISDLSSKYITIKHNFLRMTRIMHFFNAINIPYCACLIMVMICIERQRNKKFRSMISEGSPTSMNFFIKASGLKDSKKSILKKQQEKNQRKRNVTWSKVLRDFQE